MTSHSSSFGGYADKGVYISQETSHYFCLNWGTRVYFEGRGVYRSTISHYFSHNQGEHVKLLDFSGDTVIGDGIFGYRSQTRHYSSQIVYNRVDSVRRGGISDEINHSSLFNVG